MANHQVGKPNHGTAPKTFSAYVMGLSLSFVFTLLGFAFVAKKAMSGSGLYITLAVLAFLQLIVQAYCFLGLNWGKSGRQTLISFLFVILIIVILAGGSLWIMYNLNANM